MSASLLPQGCYLVSFVNGQPEQTFVGTLRVEHRGQSIRASGDLYRHPKAVKKNKIPIFARADYAFYLPKVIIEGQGTEEIQIKFTRQRYSPPAAPGDPPTLTAEREFVGQLRRITGQGANDYPDPPGAQGRAVFRGQLEDSSGSLQGEFTMGWISKYLRRATLEIDKVSGVEFPLNDGASNTWQEVFDKVLWEFDSVRSDSNVDEGDSPAWNEGELHETMLHIRAKSNHEALLDSEWRFHLLCVKEIVTTSGQNYYGLMYDSSATDSNDVAREGAAVAAAPLLGEKPIGDRPRFYFRTAVHEIGHALGLLHDNGGNRLMRQTGQLSSTTDNGIPSETLFAFQPEERDYLMHESDIWVRPGGVRYNPVADADDRGPAANPDGQVPTADGLKLDLLPVAPQVPLGAPVRVNFKLTNTANSPKTVPRDLSLKSEYVRGQVIGADGKGRTFHSLLLCTQATQARDEDEFRPLAPQKHAVGSVVLLRGGAGALFPKPGVHDIHLRIRWQDPADKTSKVVLGSTKVEILDVSSQDDSEFQSAKDALLNSRETLLGLALNSNKAAESLKSALKSRALRPHYAMMLAKPLFGALSADHKTTPEICDLLLNEPPVLSWSELRRCAKWLGRTAKVLDSPLSGRLKELADRLRERFKAMQGDLDEETAAEIQQWLLAAPAPSSALAHAVHD